MKDLLPFPCDVSRILCWLEEAPPGTLLAADQLAQQMRSLPIVSHPDPVPEKDDQLLTADEVSELLNVGRQRVYQMARDGQIPSVRIGANTIRFRRDAVEVWLNRRTR